MHEFDKKLKEMASKEKREVPISVQESIDNALQNLSNTPTKKPTLKLLKRTLSMVACIAVLTLVILPNISPAYAHSMENVPLIGRFVKVITIRNYIYQDQRHELDVSVPNIEDSNTAANWINKDVEELTQILVNQFYADLEQYGSEGYGSIHLDYEVLTDTDKWFTLKLTVHEIAASSNQYYKYYHIDKQKGKIVYLEDLFIDGSYTDLLTQEIKLQIQKRMQENPDIVYWTEESEFGEAFITIDNHHNFYWEENGDLVIPFDKYEIGPGASGTPEFRIDKSVFQNIVKAEYRTNL